MKRGTIVNIVLVVVVAFAAYKNFEKRINRTMTDDGPANSSQTGQVVVAFGDGHSALYPKILSRVLNLDVATLAVAGDTTLAALARVDDVLAKRPNFVVVTLGLDDLEKQTPLDETIRDLDTIFTRLQGGGALVAYLPIEPKVGTGDNWIMAIQQLCREKRVLLIPPVRSEGLTPELAADRVRYALEPYL